MSDKHKPPRSVACPTCGKPVPWSEASPWRPFCSERCRMIDLGEWLGEEKRIAGDPLPPTPEEWSD
jgi:endogenous inhibitor of DNA gyrase (YacG/DUF329 family)